MAERFDPGRIGHGTGARNRRELPSQREFEKGGGGVAQLRDGRALEARILFVANNVSKETGQHHPSSYCHARQPMLVEPEAPGVTGCRHRQGTGRRETQNGTGRRAVRAIEYGFPGLSEPRRAPRAARPAPGRAILRRGEIGRRVCRAIRYGFPGSEPRPAPGTPIQAPREGFRGPAWGSGSSVPSPIE